MVRSFTLSERNVVDNEIVASHFHYALLFGSSLLSLFQTSSMHVSILQSCLILYLKISCVIF